MGCGRILHFDPKSRGSGIEEGEVLHLFAPKLRKWELWLVHGIRKKSKSLQNGTCDSFAHMPAIHGRRSARRLCRDFGDIAWQYTLHNKNPWNCCNSKGFILVGMTGFEPAAFASRTHRETAIFQWFEALVSQGVSQAEISPCIFRAADITEELSVCV